jgi:23S rRNA G2069 N7-methylase RlmK/C1962 C5-methylase RlmI
MSPGLNKKAFNFLKNKGVDVVYSNSKNFSLNHSKMILIDNEIFLST